MLMDEVSKHLLNIYLNEKEYGVAVQSFRQIISDFENKRFNTVTPITNKNVYLITYGNAFYSSNEKGLQTLKKVVDKYLSDTVTDIHLLPMFPYTSDDGFSVSDYLKINSELGSWKNIDNLRKSKRLMFDFVANHMSAESKWFSKFLNNDISFKNSYVQYDSSFDTSKVIRPRVGPLFHEYKGSGLEPVKKVWTTFSKDQVDVNFSDPMTFARQTRILLEYANRGASSIRLDAIGFIWKNSGTTCMHQYEVYEIVKIWHLLLEYFAPNTQIITETNVPEKENISYLGNGYDQANQVYQFPLPPLVLFSFINQNADKLSNWASTIEPLSNKATYFNFLASHDGIGLRPTEGILNDAERSQIINHVIDNHGKVSYKENQDGSYTAYELNINYGDSLRNKNDSEKIAADKMIAAHNILISMVGVPAIYYHSIFGSRSDIKAVRETGLNRRINREKLNYDFLDKELTNDLYRKTVFNGISQLLRIRKVQKAFDPYGRQKILDYGSKIFAIERIGKEEKNIISFTNVSESTQELTNIKGLELLTKKQIDGNLTLKPYGIALIEINKFG